MTDPAQILRARLAGAKAARFDELVSTRTDLMLAVLRYLPAVLDELDVLRQTVADSRGPASERT